MCDIHFGYGLANGIKIDDLVQFEPHNNVLPEVQENLLQYYPINGI